jgi:uncharacterized Zn finger protein
MSYGSWKPYVTVAERRRKAKLAAAKATKAGARLAPIAAYRGAIAKTVWGQAWCDHLERYSDFANRLPRGRTYVRNGSVIDLQIGAGQVRAQVMGSSLYRVEVDIAALPEPQWRAAVADCAGAIDSLVELLQGRLSAPVMTRLCQPGTGLFPAPKQITLRCSCPDWAELCKHVAAVLYGVGARLDAQPELLFTLRQVDASALVTQASAGLSQAGKAAANSRRLAESMLADVFGLEMAEEPAPLLAAAAAAAPKKKATAAAVKSAPVKSAAAKSAAAKSAASRSATTQASPVKAVIKAAAEPAPRPARMVAATRKKTPARG